MKDGNAEDVRLIGHTRTSYGTRTYVCGREVRRLRAISPRTSGLKSEELLAKG